MVRIFDNGDEEYLKWLRNNPDGYIANTTPSRRSSYFFLHCASCSTITGYDLMHRKDGYTKRRNIKIAAQHLSKLVEWGHKNRALGGKEPRRCKVCSP